MRQFKDLIVAVKQGGKAVGDEAIALGVVGDALTRATERYGRNDRLNSCLGRMFRARWF